MITIRTDTLDVARRVAGYRNIAELARAMGRDRSTVSRTLAGKLEVSADFIAGMRLAFPSLTVDDLFAFDEQQVSA